MKIEGGGKSNVVFVKAWGAAEIEGREW